MGIEDFLNDFDEQNKRRKEAKLQEKSAREQQKADDENYLADFQYYYTKNIIPELKDIQEKLKPKFNLTYNGEPKFLRGSYLYTTELYPDFEHYVKKIEVQIIAEGERRLITLSGKAYGTDNKNIDRDDLHIFQNKMEIFKKINLEDKITEILNKIYLNK